MSKWFTRNGLLMFLMAFGVGAVCANHCVGSSDSGLSEWPAWVQAVGSVIAILAAGDGIRMQIADAAMRSKINDAKVRRNVITALTAELMVYRPTLVRLDETISGAQSVRFGDMLQMVFPSASFRFPVYLANAAHVGAIADEDLRSKLIGLYGDLDMFFSILYRNGEVANKIPHDGTASGETAYELKGLLTLIRDLLDTLTPRIDEVKSGLDRQALRELQYIEQQEHGF